MKIDPRFSIETRRLDDSVALIVTTNRDMEIAEDSSILFSAGFSELAELAGVPVANGDAMRDAGQRSIFSNGWQSWSFAGELAGRERVKPARILTKLNIFTYRHAETRRAGKIVSHFLTYIRAGSGRFILVSRGIAADRAGPPIAFRIDRADLGMEVETFAKGSRFSSGAVVAELRLAFREGFFAARDFLKAVFAEERRFYRLAFLESREGLVPGGYESWYNHYTDIDEAQIRKDLSAIGSNDNLINSYYIRRGKPTVFQIDDGWEAFVGDWEPHPSKFPGGMAGLARDIDSAGLIPGLWLAPFVLLKESQMFREKASWLLRDEGGRPIIAGWSTFWTGDFYALDLSLPEVEEYLVELFDRVVDEWGFRYLKLDFLYAGMLEGKRAKGGAAWEHYDRVVSRLTSKLADSQGRRIAWLGCGAPLESSFRGFPLMRIGADTRETWEWPVLKLISHQGRPSAKINLLYTIGRSILDGALFLNDPDVVFCREKGIEYGEKEKELIAVVDRLLASQIMFSDDASEFGSQGERAFTARIIELYDRLRKSEFGAERLDREVFSLFSRDGRYEGYINLRDSAYAVRDARAESLDPATAILCRASRIAGGLALEPRSISLFVH